MPGASPRQLRSPGDTRGGAGLYAGAPSLIIPINCLSVGISLVKTASICPSPKRFYLGGFCWFWGTDPIDGIHAIIVLLLYRDENNLIQLFKITLLATENSELVKWDYYSIQKCFHKKLFEGRLKRYKV